MTPEFSALEICDVLKHLISSAGISEAALAKMVNVPRATINRLTSGRTPDPRASTLKAIAEHFHISVDQLVGSQPLLWEKNKIVSSSPLLSVPMLALENIQNWKDVVERNENNRDFERITIDIKGHEKFATQIKGEAMWPQFQENTILIIDPVKKPSNRDFIIVYIEKNMEAIFRQFIMEGTYKILKAINPIFPPIYMQECDKIIGVVTQTRKNYS